MRVNLFIALATVLASVPGNAQNNVASAANTASVAPTPQAESAKPKKATKPTGDKICKRISQGKVCMTAEQWKAYDEMR